MPLVPAPQIALGLDKLPEGFVNFRRYLGFVIDSLSVFEGHEIADTILGFLYTQGIRIAVIKHINLSNLNFLGNSDWKGGLRARKIIRATKKPD